MATTIPSERLKDVALHALVRLSEPLRHDVLEDGSIAKNYGLTPNQTIPLSPGLVFDGDVLFGAFQKYADGEKVGRIETKSGAKFTGKISVDADGDGFVVADTKRYSFEGVALFSKSRDRRLKVLDRLLRSRTLLSVRAEALRNLVKRHDFGIGGFKEVMAALDASPETWAGRLREKLVGSKGVARISDLLPEDDAHWENLVPPVLRSGSMLEFVADELADEWKFRLTGDPKTAFHSIALTFVAPQVVSPSLLDGRSVAEMVAILGDAANLSDPYSRAGAYEICRARVGDLPELKAAGARLLKRIAGDLNGIERKCQVIAAVFVIASAHLAQHERFATRQVFWRRIAAMAHAGLVLRSIGVPASKKDLLGPWAAAFAGDDYLISAGRDSCREARWRAEWIVDHYLTADALGRVAPMQKAKFPVPSSWVAQVGRIGKWLEKKHLSLLAAFPAVLEGGTPSPTIVLEGDGEAVVAYREFLVAPSLERFLHLAPLIYMFGYPKGDGASIASVVKALATEVASLDDEKARRCLATAAYVAALNKDSELGGVVGEVTFDLGRRATSPQAVREGVCRLLEAAASEGDPSEGDAAIVQKLENLAFALRSKETCAELADLIKALQRVDRALAPRLSRALAAANLGKSQE